MKNIARAPRTKKQSDFITNIQTIRDRARQHVLKGAVTNDYSCDTETAVKILNEALATELVCVLRYKSHYFLAEGLHAESVKNEFKEHAAEEQLHADKIAHRIKQLNGTPDFNPAQLLERSHSEYKEGKNLLEMIKEDLIAERIAVETYREIIQYFGESDPSSRRLMESILENEEEHADELADLLKTIPCRTNDILIEHEKEV